MSRRLLWPWMALLAVLLLAVGYAGWKRWRSSEAQICQACSRPIHVHTRTVGLVGNRRELFCCPACALTTHDQSGKAVRIIELTDYETGSPLSPTQAFLVRGSDVNPCAQQHAPLTSDKQPMDVSFDRCSPSMLAFVSREAAAGFAKEHGGEVVSFADLAAAYSR